MSVTVADCLTLPSLREATVVGGAAGLNKIVASVTVLEYAEVSLLSEYLFVGNEMCITAFVTAKDDVDMQCNVIRHLYKQGVVVFVLYYVGVIVPKLDKRLIQVADELGLPLVTTPHGSMDYRYSDAIREVMEAILYDNLHEKYFVPSIIERVAQFPEDRRNIDNVLRILSDRFHTSIVVTDEQMRLVSKALWPIASALDPELLITSVKERITVFRSGKITEIGFGDSLISVFYSAIYMSGNQKMYVFVVIDGDTQLLKTPEKNTLMQIAESIQLIVSMQKYSDWSQSSNLLVNAILNDDAYRTVQIAKQAGIDIKSIHNMWILIVSEAAEDKRAEMLTTSRMLQAKAFLSDRYKTAFVGSYEESIICLMSDAPYAEAEALEALPEEFMHEICSDGEMLLLSFSDLQTRMDARKAYDAALEGWFTLKTIYRSRLIFHQQELSFALTCRRIFQQEDSSLKEHTDVLGPLAAGGNAPDALETLAVYLLDAGNNVAETAKLMHLHPNTVKYRLRDMKQKLRRDTTKLPDAYELYLAVALKRLSDQS